MSEIPSISSIPSTRIISTLDLTVSAVETIYTYLKENWLRILSRIMGIVIILVIGFIFAFVSGLLFYALLIHFWGPIEGVSRPVYLEFSSKSTPQALVWMIDPRDYRIGTQLGCDYQIVFDAVLNRSKKFCPDDSESNEFDKVEESSDGQNDQDPPKTSSFLSNSLQSAADQLNQHVKINPDGEINPNAKRNQQQNTQTPSKLPRITTQLYNFFNSSKSLRSQSSLLVSEFSYQVYLILEMPNSRLNQEQSMFMIETRFFSHHDKILHSTRRPALFHRKKSFFNYFCPWCSQIVNLKTILESNYIEASDFQETTHIEVSIESVKPFEVLSGKLVFEPILTGWRSLISHHFIFISFVTVTLLILGLFFLFVRM